MPIQDESYGLTPAETRVAHALLDGGGLPAVAKRLGIRTTTARTLLQRAFEKTGTHRQSELACLLLRGNPGPTTLPPVGSPTGGLRHTGHR